MPQREFGEWQQGWQKCVTGLTMDFEVFQERSETKGRKKALIRKVRANGVTEGE